MLTIAETLALIEEVYADLPAGGDADAGDRLLVEERAGRSTATYGEISPEAARELLNWLRPEARDVFVDVGSGTGRLAIQGLLTSDLGRSVGIELSPFRHAVACRARDELSRRDPSIAARLAAGLLLIEGDFRDHFPAVASLIWAGSICFPSALMSALGRAVVEAEGLRRFVTLKQLPAAFAASLRELATVDLDMSWTRSVRATIYGPNRR